MARLSKWCFVLLPLAALPVDEQPGANRPDFTGVWAIYRGQPAPPAAGPLVLKPEFAKPYEAQRAAQAEANQRGEQLANGSVQCVPYGVPTMMSVAVYPVEFIQTRKQ